MSNKYITILVVAVVGALIMFMNTRKDAGPVITPEMFAVVIRNQARATGQNYYPSEEMVGKRTLVEMATSQKENKLILLVGEEWLSGSGGDGGAVLMSKLDGSKAQLIGWFSNYLDKSLALSPDEKMVVFTQLDASNLCIGRSYKIINLNSDSAQEVKVPENVPLIESVVFSEYKFEPARWISNDDLSLQVPLTICAESSTDYVKVGQMVFRNKSNK